MAMPPSFIGAAGYYPQRGYYNAHPELPIGIGQNTTTYNLNGKPISGGDLTAMTEQPGFMPGGQLSASTQTPGTPNFPNYGSPSPETPDANPATTASASVPTQMQDFSQWLNQIMGQQFPYGGGQGGGGGVNLIPSPTS